MAYTSQHTGTAIDNAVSEHNNLIQTILNTIYPVGSLYTSFNSTNPSTIIGGTWTQIKDCFLMAAGTTYAAGSSGGAASHTHTTGDHTLTVAQTPVHTHTRGTMNITGGFKVDPGTGWCRVQGTGAFTSGYATGPWMTGGSSGDTINCGMNFDASQSWTGATSSVGGGAAHNHGNTGSTSNIPPYQTIYMWKRTA